MPMTPYLVNDARMLDCFNEVCPVWGHLRMILRDVPPTFVGQGNIDARWVPQNLFPHRAPLG